MSIAEGLLINEASDSAAAPRDAAARNALRTVLGRFATGVTVVAAGTGDPRGMTANSFTSVSLDPPLVLVCVNRHASIHQSVLESGSFAISVLAAGQEHVARYFADRSRPRGMAEFGGVRWSPAPSTGAPVLEGALAWLDCALTASYEGGDHVIFVGSIMASGCGPAHDALLFYRGSFHAPQLVTPGKP